ncbi:MAG: HEAT repeat domain-containing protein [Polyangia bacterium]
MRRLNLSTCTWLVLAFLAAAGCEDRSYRDIGAQINTLTKPGGGSADEAIAQLARMGRRTLPQIETALHTASPRGKSNLIRALDAVGDPEAAAIVQHFAVYDASDEVRAACEELLQRWATAGDRRAGPARQALARVNEKRAKGEGPE